MLVGLQSLGVQLANDLRFGIKVLIMAVEPIFALVRFEVDVLQDTPDAGAADRGGVSGLEQGRNDLIQGPPRDGTIVVVGQSAGHRDHLHPRGWGNSPWTPRAPGILQTGEAQFQVAPSPFAHCEVGTPQLTADLQVGRLVHCGSS